MQSRLLLDGSFFPGGHHDLDYFFYEYRVHHVEQFTREVAEAVRKVRPGVEFSAAVFRNPVQSGRFLGQDWRRFSPWVQYLMPMDYRSHYAGDLNAHLELLAESIQQQKTWARDFPHLWIGVAAYQLYDEERQPLSDLRALIRAGGPSASARAVFDKVSARLRTVAPDLHAGIESYLREAKADATLAAKLDAFLASPPPDFYPPERFLKTLETVRAQEVEGIVVFSTSFLTSGRLWDALGRFFEQ
jgi:hypothetical protein